jgi:hypothetical protein
MSWTQVYVSGIDPSITVDQFELALSESSLFDDETLWAGPGTTVLKQALRSNNGAAPSGYCFLAFHSMEGGLTAVEQINNYDAASAILSGLHAEISQPQKKKGAKKAVHAPSENTSSLRLRRMRAGSGAKHPVLDNTGYPAKKNTMSSTLM